MSHTNDTITEPDAPAKPGPRRPRTKLSIYEVIPKIIGELPAIGKNSSGEGVHYKFRGIEDIMPHVADLFAKYGVFPVPHHAVTTDEEVLVGRNNYKQTRIVTSSTFRFYATDGTYVPVTTIGEARDSGDKAANKAETAAYKYALIQLLCINDGDDPDRVRPEQAEGEQRGPVVVGEPGKPFPDGAQMPEGGPWALTDAGVLVYAETPNYAALAALSDALVTAGVKDLVREWADTNGVSLHRGHDEPGVARVVEYAEGLLVKADQDAAEGAAVPLDPDAASEPPAADAAPTAVDKVRAQLAEKGIEVPDDTARLAAQMAEAVADRGDKS